MKTCSIRRLSLFFLAAASLLPGAAPGANLTWNTPTQITSELDVRTAGTLLGAFNLGPTGVADTTVNGVAFAAFGVPVDFAYNATNTVGNFSLHFDYRYGSNGLGSNQAPFTALSAPYQALLGSGVADDANDALTLTMNGLTVGQRYAFQFWSSDASNTSYFNGTVATAGNAVTMNSNTINAVGGLGQFAVGTFTADATSQVVSFNSTGLPLVNAFQLRAVPEPSTWAAVAAGTGLLGLGTRCRRVRRRAVSRA